MSIDQEPATIILVGVDGSESSIEALRQGVKLAVALGARVKAVTCWNTPTVYQVPYSLGSVDFKGVAQEILDKAIERAFGLDWPENLTTDLIQGSARPTLIEASRDATLLVLGRRGFGGFTGLLMGSVSSACAAHAHCPVVIVHAPKNGEDHA
ncbi:MAG: universal stress protein [Specibacter sp.]